MGSILNSTHLPALCPWKQKDSFVKFPGHYAVCSSCHSFSIFLDSVTLTHLVCSPQWGGKACVRIFVVHFLSCIFVVNYFCLDVEPCSSPIQWFSDHISTLSELLVIYCSVPWCIHGHPSYSCMLFANLINIISIPLIEFIHEMVKYYSFLRVVYWRLAFCIEVVTTPFLIFSFCWCMS